MFLFSEMGTLGSWSSSLLTLTHLLHTRRPLPTAPSAQGRPAGSASSVLSPCPPYPLQVALNSLSTRVSPTGHPTREAGVWETVRDQCRCQYILNSILPHCFWFSFIHESFTLHFPFQTTNPVDFSPVSHRETSAAYILCNKPHTCVKSNPLLHT